VATCGGGHLVANSTKSFTSRPQINRDGGESVAERGPGEGARDLVCRDPTKPKHERTVLDELRKTHCDANVCRVAFVPARPGAQAQRSVRAASR